MTAEDSTRSMTGMPPRSSCSGCFESGRVNMDSKTDDAKESTILCTRKLTRSAERRTKSAVELSNGGSASLVFHVFKHVELIEWVDKSSSTRHDLVVGVCAEDEPECISLAR